MVRNGRSVVPSCGENASPGSPKLAHLAPGALQRNNVRTHYIYANVFRILHARVPRRLEDRHLPIAAGIRVDKEP